MTKPRFERGSFPTAEARDDQGPLVIFFWRFSLNRLPPAA